MHIFSVHLDAFAYFDAYLHLKPYLHQLIHLRLSSSSSSGHVEESVKQLLSNSKTRSRQQLQEEVEEPSHNCSILSHAFDSKDQVLCWRNLFTCYLDASFQQFSNKPVFSSFRFLLTYTFERLYERFLH